MVETSYEFVMIDLTGEEREFLKVIFPKGQAKLDGIISQKLDAKGEAQVWSEDELARINGKTYEMAKFLMTYRYDANHIDGQQNTGKLLHMINSLADDILVAWEQAVDLRKTMEIEDLLNLRDNLARLCQEYNDGKMTPKDFISDYDAYIDGLIY